MIGPRTTQGGRVLLFDRLTDQAPDQPEAYPVIFYDNDGLKSSVRKELEKLFSTRQSGVPPLSSVEKRTTLSYGIPDATNLSPDDSAGRNTLAQEMTTAITLFEPRLLQPTVTLIPAEGQNGKIIARIDGTLVCERDRERVNFTLSLEMKYGNG